MQRALEEAVARVRDMEAGAALMGAENAALKQQVRIPEVWQWHVV
jgi:hypothetical protein